MCPSGTVSGQRFEIEVAVVVTVEVDVEGTVVVNVAAVDTEVVDVASSYSPKIIAVVILLI